MSRIEIKSLVSVFQVSNISQSLEWYKKWLGEPDIIPIEGTAEYQISPNTWLQLSYNEVDKIKTSELILGVEDIKLTKSTLDNLGLETGELIDYEVVLVFDIFDIDGNKITFAQEL